MKCLCSAQCLDLLQNLVLSGIVTGTSSKPIALHWNPKKVLITIIYSTEIVCWEYQVIFNRLWTVLWSKVFLFQYLNIWIFFFFARHEERQNISPAVSALCHPCTECRSGVKSKFIFSNLVWSVALWCQLLWAEHPHGSLSCWFKEHGLPTSRHVAGSPVPTYLNKLTGSERW